ncbi:MAG: Fic family protein [Vicinamibacterales bacterium]
MLRKNDELPPPGLMRYLTLGEVVTLHRRVLAQSGGASGIRDLGLLESALAQPKASFDGHDLHPTLIDKAAALGLALVANHAFVDGNKSASAMRRWRCF